MRTWQVMLMVMMAALMMVSGAMADGPFNTKARFDYEWPDVIPAPMDEFADSIKYFDDEGGLWYFTGTGSLYSQVRFTAPVEFELRGVSILTRNAPTGGIPFYIYEDNNGSPGNTIAVIYNVPTVIQGNPSYVVADFDPSQYVTIDGGTDFWVSFQTSNIAEWMPYFDDASTGARNWYGSSPGNPQFEVSGDWYITAGGAYTGSFYDGAARFLSSSNFRFHQVSGTDVTFTTELTNLGNEEAPATNVVFSVVDTMGTTVWTDQVAVPALSPGALLEVTSGATWTTPDETMRYIADVDYQLPGDGNQDNNTYPLQQQVIEYGVTFAGYDDSTPESNVIVNDGNGSGAVFYPPTYPAELTQVVFVMNDDPDNGNAILRAFTLNANFILTEVWTREGVQPGVNVFNLPTPAQVNEGGFFLAVTAEGGDVVIPVDNDAPISGGNNPQLGAAAMPFASGTWLADDPANLYINISGNYMMRAKMDETEVADIVFPPIPFNMGDDAVVGEPYTFELPFENVGAADGHLIDLIGVPGALEIADAANLPITIPAGGSYNMEIVWTPTQEGTTTFGFQIEHDDLSDDNPIIIGLVGNASADVAYTDPAVPDEYFLAQNRPNPFNPETTIRFGLEAPGKATLTVYNVMGQKVATLLNQELTAGTHTVTFDASHLPSGVYFYGLESKGFNAMHKMMLMK